MLYRVFALEFLYRALARPSFSDVRSSKGRLGALDKASLVLEVV
jgi:hypothetical protein